MKSGFVHTTSVWTLLLVFASAQPNSSLHADDAHADSTTMPPAALDYLSTNCIDCHDGVDGEGGFDVQALMSDDGRRLDDDKNLHRWIRVFDRVHDGEMPPEDYGEVDAETTQDFIKTTHDRIDGYISMRHETIGRVGARRLTNDQLERTLHDLLAIDVPLSRLIPEEVRTDGFRNIADAQSMSHYHLADHLNVVDTALDAAFARVRGRQDNTVLNMPPSRIANKRPGQRNRDPEMRKGAAVVWNSTLAYYGRISNSTLYRPGWYRITFKASALRQPDGKGVWCSVRSGECVSRAPLMNWIGSFEATETPTEHTYTAWIDEDHMLEIRPADATLKRARFQGGQAGYGEAESQNVPGLALHSLRIERVYPGGDVDDVREQLFGKLDVEFDRKRRRLKLREDTPPADIEAQIHRFARAAFRAPVGDKVVKQYVEAFESSRADGVDPVEALRMVYRAILCSPRFLYFQESPGKLSDHAIASRLSYLITGSAPDEELSRLADQDKLSDPDTLAEQVRRLLHNREVLSGFVADFSDQWLDLADISFTEPDRKLHRDFDLVVKNAMLGETRRFLETILSENRPVSQLVSADFTWLNSRLARYYGLDQEVPASEWQLVSLKDHPHRGGLMTQGSILKVTANGTNTSPVLRGVWICDRLLGTPIPDPPENVPAIEPDIRGAKTIREILEKHRSQTECASCHSKIDPPGFALEHFDAAGRWRERYAGARGKSGGKIDASYELADGTSFESFAEFRELAATQQANIARNLAAQLLVYATGREITFADRKALDQIVRQTAPQYNAASIIEAVVTSKPFLHK